MARDNYFQEALLLAESVKGSTSPNPAVGAVIVKDGVIVATGVTQSAGGDHAEAMALKRAGERARGASMYVTLEPCVDYPEKRTPSCTNRIIEAGVREIFIGRRDPNPQVNGRGIETLKRAGIQVREISIFSKRLRVLNEDFEKYIRGGVPFVYSKYAMTLDGNIANAEGDSKWVSGSESLKRVHSMRNRVDVILVGIGTVFADNPALTVREVPKIKNPLRVIVDPRGETPENATVLTDENATVFVTDIRNDDFIQRAEKMEKRVLVMKSPFSYRELLARLAKDYGVTSVLIEGGGRVHYRCLNEGIIDKLMVFVAPKILGGRGIQPFNGVVERKMDEALKLFDISVENLGEDLLIQGYLNEQE